MSRLVLTCFADGAASIHSCALALRSTIRQLVFADREGTHSVLLTHDELLAYRDRDSGHVTELRALIGRLAVRAPDLET